MKKTFSIGLMTLAACSMLFISGCSMDREPHNAKNLSESLKTVRDANHWSSTMLVQLRGRQYGYYVTRQEYRADCLNAHIGYMNNSGDYYKWTLNISDYDIKDIYHDYYVGIKTANYFLAHVDEIKEVPKDWQEDMKSFKSLAHFVRAYYYYELSKRWGLPYDRGTGQGASDMCVPLVKVYDPEAKPGRNTNKEVYDAIYDDIAQARSLMPWEGGRVGSNYLTADAITALEARVALDVKDYKTAYEASKSLIETGTYPLVAATVEAQEEMWRKDGSTEDILRMKIKKTDEEPNTNGYYSLNSDLSWRYDVDICKPLFLPTQGVIDLFESGDTRRPIYFEDTTTEDQGKLYDCVVVSKFRGNKEYDNSWVPREIIAPKVFRIAEQYLIAAEAAFKLGDEISATRYLNVLRTSRGLSAVSASGGDLFREIKNERCRELAFEGFRYFDLKRWGDPMNRMEPQLDKSGDPSFLSPMGRDLKVRPGDTRWIWPLPHATMIANPSLKGQQNPGW